MELKLELLSLNRSLLGLSYMKGQGVTQEGKEKTFHEFGFGLIFINIMFTFYEKGEN